MNEKVVGTTFLCALAQESGLLTWGTLTPNPESPEEANRPIDTSSAMPSGGWTLLAQVHHQLFAELEDVSKVQQADSRNRKPQRYVLFDCGKPGRRKSSSASRAPLWPGGQCVCTGAPGQDGEPDLRVCSFAAYRGISGAHEREILSGLPGLATEAS